MGLLLQATFEKLENELREVNQNEEMMKKNKFYFNENGKPNQC